MLTLPRASAPAAARARRLLAAGALGVLAAVVGALAYFAIASLTGYEFGLGGIGVGLLVGAAVRRGSRGRGGWAYQTMAVLLTYLAIVSSYIPRVAKELASYRAPVDARMLRAERLGAPSEGKHGHDGSAGLSSPSVGERPEKETGFAVVQAGAAAAAEPTRDARGEPITVGVAIVGFASLLLFAAMVPFLSGLSNAIGSVIILVAAYQAWRLNRRVALQAAAEYPVDGRTAAG